MKTAPLVTIVLPVYNGARFLTEAIESCLAQTFVDWELIIVDDASTDETPLIISQYCKQDIRIRTVRHETNRKLPAALNTGFVLARGNLLTWTSDDNYYHHGALESMVGFITKTPEVDVVYTDYMRIDDVGRELGACTVLPVEQIVYGNIIGACFLYRRVVHETLGGYNEGLFLAEDYDFWLRASRSFRLSPLHEILYSYRVHDASLTKTRNKKIFLAHEIAVLRNLPFLPWVTADIRTSVYRILARKAKERGLYFRAFLYRFRVNFMVFLRWLSR